ncbi:MAG: amino acid permease [Gammaproteobacteria bacterium]|nr:amino acid permease [Gammaproteobacteria bacterium]
MKQKFGVATAHALVIGSIVGTGVFTSLGFQLLEFDTGFVLMLLWVLGGLCAFCGSVCYCELSARLPRSGGEYNFLTGAFHPAIGFVAGWLSFTIGFAAPAALVAMTFGAYLEAGLPWVDPQYASIALVVIVTAVHAHSHRASGGLQTSFTFVKVGFILLVCIAAWLLVHEFQPVSFVPMAADIGFIVSGGFAVSLIYVNYAYAGWNAMTYVSEELEQPTQTINRALMLGVGTVVVLYLVLNATFLLVAPIDAMRGEVEVGYIVARHAFGEQGAWLISIALAVLLISTLSAFILAGPRVLSRIGSDYPVLGWLAKTNARSVPAIAVAMQSTLTLVFLLTGTFETILIFAGLILGISSFATVCAACWLRYRLGPPVDYQMPLYPLPAVVFLSVMGWTIIYATAERVIEGLLSIAMIALGFMLYAATRLMNAKRRQIAQALQRILPPRV